MLNHLLLFDIDGTLLSGRGVPKETFLEVVLRRFPQFIFGEILQLSGLTDPLIVKKIFELNNFPMDGKCDLIDEILNEFTVRLQERMNRQNPPRVLLGVTELLDCCVRLPNCYLGLVTGNIAAGAKIKLESADLYHYFPVGAFGSDHWDRNRLPPLAINRSQKYYNRNFSIENIWIIGDSVHDVRCAKANGLKCLAVHSSITPRQVLVSENPDVLVDSLQDTAAILGHLGLTVNEEL